MYGVVSLDIVITPALGETFFCLIGQKHIWQSSHPWSFRDCPAHTTLTELSHWYFIWEWRFHSITAAMGFHYKVKLRMVIQYNWSGNQPHHIWGEYPISSQDGKCQNLSICGKSTSYQHFFSESALQKLFWQFHLKTTGMWVWQQWNYEKGVLQKH